jgi:hypothetical protein
VSRKTVRAAIQAYLVAGLPGIPGLNRVYRAAPWFADGSVIFNLSAELGNGAWAFLNLAHSKDTRKTVPAVLGTTFVHYDVSIVVCYQFLIPSAMIDTTITEDMWVDACDDILEGLKALIHADPNLGHPGTIFLAAQTPDSLQINSDDPRLEPGKVYSWHTVDFQVTEVIQA